MVNGQAPDSLLHTYDTKRRTFARKLVETTDRLFSSVTAEGGFVRTRIAPIFATVAFNLDRVCEFMFRVVSQTTLNDHESILSECSGPRPRRRPVAVGSR